MPFISLRASQTCTAACCVLEKVILYGEWTSRSETKIRRDEEKFPASHHQLNCTSNALGSVKIRFSLSHNKLKDQRAPMFFSACFPAAERNTTKVCGGVFSPAIPLGWGDSWNPEQREREIAN
jgi:hypothetical protein